MADFNEAFGNTMTNEGGYVLHKNPGDTGGLTYAGIARNRWPDWPGWAIIDRDVKFDDNKAKLYIQHVSPILVDMVADFYREHFWKAIMGDEIHNQVIANDIYDFSVNAGTRVAIKLAQAAVCVVADGYIGPKTIEALNNEVEGEFKLAYAIAKITRYMAICKSNSSQKVHLYGWIYRVLRGLR